jgi:2,3-bisphosphoglycerate-independent phosphoglycerate mutase
MERKYIILVGDGMGDYPLDRLGGKTPLEVARTPNIDRLLSIGRSGLVHTIPPGMEPGSDIANMSLLGYDPRKYHTGRAPLEAASMGIHIGPKDIAFRCNLVTLSNDAGSPVRMEDYSAGHITTEEAHALISALQEAVADSPLSLYPGISYRHLLVWANGRADIAATPPHDISGEPIAPHEKGYREEPVLLTFIEKAAAILAAHPVNLRRISKGKRPANAVWLWGQGGAPVMPTLKERFGLSGAMISAVDLLKGIGVYAGLEPIRVPGATGYLDTNYAGKVEATLRSLDTGQLVYTHIEAPDEASHEGSLEKKIEAIEAFDEKVVGPVLEGARKFPKVRLLIATDHLTPIVTRTHASDPAPFLLVEDLHGSAGAAQTAGSFCEREALRSEWVLNSGVELFNSLIGVNA